MKIRCILRHAVACVVVSLMALSAAAQNYPTPKEGDWIARDFRFHTGEAMSELRLHFRTVGEPSGEPVLILHGTTGSGASMLSAAFAGELFGPGQPLDANKYFIILPDAIGHGKSSKPSDGMRAKFPRYNYDDMVAAQYKLVTDGLRIRHLRLVLGQSMGGMHTFIWGMTFPEFMDALVPMASQPTEMSSRNWMMRRLITDTIRNDPEWNNGNVYVSLAVVSRGVAPVFSASAEHDPKRDPAPWERAGVPVGVQRMRVSGWRSAGRLLAAPTRDDGVCSKAGRQDSPS